ncbi:MAG: hypothetical protein RL068_867 [Actinomycetota bacterium]
MEQKTRLVGGFQIGLTGGLGVMAAVVLGTALGQIATILTYIAIALFLALGLDPLVRGLIKAKLPRALAVAIVVLGFLGAVAFVLSLIIPSAVYEAGKLIQAVPQIATNLVANDLISQWDSQLGGAISSASDGAIGFVSDAANWPGLVGGVLQVGIGLLNGALGFVIVVILTLYFMSALESMKDYLAKMVAASKREKFRALTDQIAYSVGRWVMGQSSIALIHAVAVYTFLSAIDAPYGLLLASAAFLLALIPLVGPLTSGILVTSISLVSGVDTAMWVGIFYLVYLQVEAYLISPRIMKKAVAVPASLVVIAALVGGTLMGVLGALIAIPVAASVLLIVREVWMPRQQLR